MENSSAECPLSCSYCPYLKLECIRHQFGKTLALDDVTLSVIEGEILCLVGPSGCGKTTLLRIAAGLEVIQNGTVHIGALTVAKDNDIIPSEARNIGLVFQECALFPHLNVLDNVRFGLWRLPRHEQKRKALEILAQIGLETHHSLFPHQLSGGQQQRVALARAIAPCPSLLLMDEPFNGLDLQLRHAVREQTLQILRRHHLTAILVTHDPEEAMYLGDRIAIMNQGRIEQCDTPLTLYSQPANSFVAEFFGQVYRVEGIVQSDGNVPTPFGNIKVGYDPCGCCMSEGKPVEILIRPEAISLASDPGPNSQLCSATVLRIRQLGQNNLIQLGIQHQQATFYWSIKTIGNTIPKLHQKVDLTLDLEKTFVFPRNPCTPETRDGGCLKQWGQDPSIHP